MDDPYAHVLEYRPYLLSIYVVLILNYILGRIIFVPGDNNKRSNGAPDVLDFSIFY